jgi:hypothetical protein
MVFPRSADFIFVLLEQPKRRRNLMVAEAVILREFHHRFQPEFGLTGSILHVHVRPQLLAREEVEPVPAYPKDRGAHAKVIGSPPDKLPEMQID